MAMTDDEAKAVAACVVEKLMDGVATQAQEVVRLREEYERMACTLRDVLGDFSRLRVRVVEVLFANGIRDVERVTSILRTMMDPEPPSHPWR